MYQCFASFILTVLTISVHSQSETSPKPFLLNKTVLSGIGLQKVDIKDEPEKDFYQKRLYRGQDISIYIVSTESWNNEMVNFPFDEFIYMFHGEANVRPTNGPSQVFRSGEYFFAPKGYTGDWEIRAGEHLHYELSVISNARADTSLIDKTSQHQLFDPSILSGAHITLDQNGQYTEILRKGIELTVKLNAEKPDDFMEFENAKEMLICLLSGKLSLRNTDATVQEFYSGDYFVLPQDWKGQWKGEGHGLVKFISVERTRMD